jgi:ATP-dependent DNA helicase RecG
MATGDDLLRSPLRYLRGVGPKRAADLQRAGLATVEDLLHRFPIRYEDRGHLQPIAALGPGRTASVAGEIASAGLRGTRRPGFKIFEALVRDRTGAVRAVWLNQPFLRDVLKPHDQVVLFGPVEMRGDGGLQLTNPQYEILPAASAEPLVPGAAPEPEPDEGATVHTGRIVPVYERAGSLTPKMQRQIVFDVLHRLPAALDDPLPVGVRERLGLPGRRAALQEAHFPPDDRDIELLNRFRTPAQVRLIFEEFFLFQLGLLLRRRAAGAERKVRVPCVDDRIREAARRVLPFRLTGDQRRALKEIVDDMQRPQPMNRLLQGDVGSGKTIVALLAALVAMENGLQVAFMAPTEILAEQHAGTIARLLQASRFRVVLLTGSMPAARRRRVWQELGAGAAQLVVGTHALVQEAVTFRELGLAIIDEQHRFGVMQRATLRAKGLHPDVLVMTATPIPRTLALTTYGDLDVSVIREMPPGRKPVKTLVKPDARRDEIFAFVRQELDAGRQAYIVYPIIEESEKVDLRPATEMADHLAQEVFQAYRVALLHGRMKAAEKDGVMEAFVAGRIDVLVSTTVIEVGVDVPNATVMIIEHAERFGLAQLHQLRGRVGRGAHQAYCILLYQPPLVDHARERLKAMAETTDGFELAEKDLQLRGPGDFFGTRQSGMPTLRIGDLLRDHTIMEEARREAVTWLDAAPPADPLVGLVRGTWEHRFGLVGIG